MTDAKARILLAEDAHESREPLKLLLELAGYECLEACDGRAAVEIALREQPDLILMDLSLPEMDGLQAVHELRAAGASLPIIVVSAYDDVATRARAQEAGANGYVTKPIEFEELKAQIAQQLRPV